MRHGAARQEHFIRAYLKTAYTFGQLSHAKKRKVGCVIEKDDNIISYGYNGMPEGFPNKCESNDHVWTDRTYQSGVCNKCAMLFKAYDLCTNGYSYICTEEHTLPEVLHAESNALMKVAQSTLSCRDANMYITYYPCIECAKLIISCKILNLYVLDDVFLTSYKKPFKDFTPHEFRAKNSEELFRKASLIVKCYDKDYNLYRDKGTMINDV